MEALKYLKEKHGVQHRNIKPCNIFLDQLGEVRLSDFRIPDRHVNTINTHEYTLYAAVNILLLIITKKWYVVELKKKFYFSARKDTITEISEIRRL